VGSSRTGALIGAIGGVVFVLANAGALGSPASVVLRVVGVAAFAVVLWWSVLRRGAAQPGPPPAPGALRTYLLCVVGEVLAIPLGAQLLVRAVGRPELVLPWVVLVVGVHFLPFARTFRVPLFAALAWSLVVLGLLGGALAVAVGPVLASAAGVLAGFVLLAFAAAGGSRRRAA
jgi:hypothetical protein